MNHFFGLGSLRGLVNSCPPQQHTSAAAPTLPPPPPTSTPLVPCPTGFARSLGFFPDPDQQQILNAIIPRGILNCSRQWGKSTITVLKAVHRAVYHPESLVLVISPSGRQSATFLEKAKQFVMKLGHKPKGDGHNEIEPPSEARRRHQQSRERERTSSS